MRKTTLNAEWKAMEHKDLENHYLYNNLKYKHWKDIAYMTISAMENIKDALRTLDMAKSKGIKFNDVYKYNYKTLIAAIDNLREEIEIARLRHLARADKKLDALNKKQKEDKP